jgi:GNAT superfamily N-acetyltransferase
MGVNAPADGDAIDVVYSFVESERFGLNIGRCSIPVGSNCLDDEVVLKVVNSAFDLVILRYPSARIRLNHLIAAQSKNSFQADTLLYLSREIDQDGFDQSAGAAGVRPARAHDEEAIRNVALKAFNSYGSHYSANPRIDKDSVLDGYVDWASRQMHDATVVLVHQTEVVDGFLSLRINNEVAEIVLNAVDPFAQNQGIYQRLLDGAVQFAYANNCNEIITSTQSTNYKVMRVWTKNKFNIFLSLNTVHLNLT